jgi:(1->4)-alpha-D-glucan 1-alpha-D-glucosylmutase
MKGLAERVDAYMIKAVREGKQQSSWSNPNTAYEAALQRFVQSVLDASRPNPFLTEFRAFAETLARPGAITSLAQLALKLTVPGVPDIYQGGELWDFSMVDPDNRRPVDWDVRRALLDEVADASPAKLSEQWQDGREKLFTVRRLLELRREHPTLFAEGDYQPLETEGEASSHLCAFARNHGDETIVVAVPRLVHQLYRGGQAAEWGGTEIALPLRELWEDVFTGRKMVARERIPAAELLAEFPISVLIADGSRTVD